MSINPIKLNGNWEEGFALDVHVIRSVYVGENEYGYPRYETTRSEMGELIYLLKYSHKEDVVCDIMKLVEPFLITWDAIRNIDVVIPVPPTRKSRRFQPVFLIAQEIAKSLGKPIFFNLLERVSTDQVKNLTSEQKVEAISGSIIKNKSFKRKADILLVDDLYQTGATIKEVCSVLKKDRNVNDLYVLTMTKTKG